jgi:hypothetical protein
MNCAKCQELLSDFIDGSLNADDASFLGSHLNECLECLDVRNDLHSIVSYCQTHRGEYVAPPNEKALWLRIRNMIEVGNSEAIPAAVTNRSWNRWRGRSWELSLPKLVASVAAIVLIVSLTTAVGLRRWQGGQVIGTKASSSANMDVTATNVLNRVQRQEQMIEYWNQRVEANKLRWSPQMRAAFDRNLKVIDEAVNVSMSDLQKDPHDEVSEEMLNTALDEKLSMLKEFADL